MSMAGTSAPPARQRIDALDVLRGFAVCGMLLINIPIMGRSVWDIFSNPNDAWTLGEHVQYWIRELFFEGSSRAMFSILFGASFMLMMSKVMQPADPVAPVDIYYRRCCWMMLFGVIHATLLLWPGDILFHYALPGMALFAFRKADPRLLLGLAAVFMVVLNLVEASEDLKLAKVYRDAQPAIAKQVAGQALSDAESVAVKKYQAAKESKSKSNEDYRSEVEARRGYFSSVAFQSNIWVQWLDFDAFGWALEAFTFMLIGIALFKLGILTGERSVSFYLVLGTVSMLLGIAINFHETWLKVTTSDAPGVWLDEITYQHGRLAICLGNIGLIIAALKSNLGRIIFRPLQDIGRMALSNYIGQSLIAAIVFTGLGMFGKLNNLQLWTLAAMVWVFQAVCSRYWFKYYRMGPMEWLWKSLTMWEVQPITRQRPLAIGVAVKS